MCDMRHCGSDGRKVGRAVAVLGRPGVPSASGQAEDARPLMQPLPLSPTGAARDRLSQWRTGQPALSAAAHNEDTSRLRVSQYKGRHRHAGAGHAMDLELEAVTRTLADYRIEPDAAQNPMRQGHS